MAAWIRRYPMSLLAAHSVTFLNDRLTTDEIGVIRDRQRPTSEITLHLIATFLHQERMLGFGLDPFRQDRQIKGSAETDDCSHDGLGVMVVFQITNKDAINLDFVTTERLQIRQGRISRSEIVHRNPYAERLEATQDRHRTREVINHYTLGDLQFEATRSKASLEQDRMDKPRQIALAELDR